MGKTIEKKYNNLLLLYSVQCVHVIIIVVFERMKICEKQKNIVRILLYVILYYYCIYNNRKRKKKIFVLIMAIR